MLPRNFQSRYRRHLFNFKLLFQLLLARRSLNQLSRFTIHLVQEFHIRRIQSRKNVIETNIVVIHDQIPHSLSPLSVFSALASSSLPNKTEKKTKKSASSSLSASYYSEAHFREKTDFLEREKNLSRGHTTKQRTEALPALLFRCVRGFCERKRGRERSARPFCGAVVLLLSSFSLPFERGREDIENTHARFVRPILPRGNDGARKMETRRTRASRNAKNERCFDEANEEA